jgi:hypothetical protein
MSYDLYMKPRVGTVGRARFLEYFKSRTHYECADDQSWYRNEDTGVYFVFEYSDTVTTNAPDLEDGASSYQLSFNINYCRPSFFGTEAEPELNAFIERFDLLVDDPQIDGMGVGEYDTAKFLYGWSKGNELGYQAVMQGGGAKTIFTAPTSELERIWRWNLERRRLQTQIGEGCFVPRIFFLELEGAAKSAVVWPDAIPLLLPRVDYLFVDRQDLAPRRFFRAIPDRALLPWHRAEPVIKNHASLTETGAYVLNYSSPPSKIVEMVRNLSPHTQALQGIATDAVLNAELVAKYLARQTK